VVQSAVMNEVVNFSRMQYAVIEALQTEAGSERFVIAYRSEQSLHDVIAEPCIIAFGFSSREEALATAEPWVSAAAA
jgi:thymidylate synthase